MVAALAALAAMVACACAKIVTVLPGLPPPSQCPPRELPPAPAGLVASSSLDSVLEHNRVNSSQELFVFVSGNSAMNAMLLNWAASVYALGRRRFHFFAVPLDRAGAEALAATGYLPLYHDHEAMAAFGAQEGLFGAKNYQAMARYKWQLAAAVVARNQPVLWSDPDIVVFRNPLPYLDSLPDCDVVLQGEMAALGILDDILADGAMSSHRVLAHYVPRQGQLFNTGFVRILPTERSKRLLAHVLATFADLSAHDRHHDDQEIFNALINSQYVLVGSNLTDPRARNAHFQHQMSHGQCATLRRRSTGDTFTAWVLNPLTFPLRPTHDDPRTRNAALELPYLKHYNWVIGAAYKTAQMKGDCNWFLPP